MFVFSIYDSSPCSQHDIHSNISNHNGGSNWEDRLLPNNTGQQNLTIYVPRFSVDEFSSTFYTEFRYVNRIFLSKIQRNLNIENITLIAHETGRNFPLNVEAYEFRHYLASGTSLFSGQQYSTNILEVHLPWYRFSFVIMSWWNFSPCSSLTSPRFSGKKSKCDSRKWIFRLILHSIAL